MGTLKVSNAHALATKVRRNNSTNSKHNEKKYQARKEDSPSMQATSDSKGGKPKKGNFGMLLL